MIRGLSLHALSELHVLISLIGIASGLIVVFGMTSARPLPGWTALFLVTTLLTSVSGFLFPAQKVTPAQIVGLISLILLALAMLGLYRFRLAGPWRRIYVVSAVIALYFNCFVGVIQAFLKIPALHALAPKGNEPPFVAAQLLLLVLFVVLGFRAVRGFSPKP